MSTFTLCIDCLTPITIPEAFKTVMRQDDDGTIYLNLKFNEKEQCDDYEAAFGCLQDVTLEGLAKLIIVEDDCGYCALNILANICDVCGFTEEQQQL